MTEQPMLLGHERLVRDAWFSEVLERDAYRIVVDDRFVRDMERPEFREALAAVKARPVFLFAKVPVTALPVLAFLETEGFHLVDTNVVFDKPAGSAPALVGECEVRFATADDEGQVVDVARESFVFSRFHLDPAFPDPVADELKAAWVANYFAGERGDRLVVALVDGRVVGFNQLLERGEELVIDLIAVDGRHRRKGIAADMIAFAESECGKCSRLRVGTQVANVPSVRLYEKLGFRLSEAQYVLHYHRLRSDA